MIKIESLSPYVVSEEKEKVFLFKEATVSLSGGDGVAIIGPNGSGKSTLIKSILGIHSNYDGTIHVNRDLAIGYMPQNYRGALLSWLSIKEHFRRCLESDEMDLAEEFLSNVNFSAPTEQRLYRLSGGELQLVLLATILGKNSDILLLDEPFSAIDFTRREKVTEILKSEIEEKKKSLIMVSHQLDEPKNLCRKLIVISGYRNQTVSHIPVTDDLTLKSLLT